MTWTCTSCGNDNQDHEVKCTGRLRYDTGTVVCGADGPAKLSKEERAEWWDKVALTNLDALFSKWTLSALLVEGLKNAANEDVIENATAARAPLEAELIQAHEREAMAIMERDRARKDAEAELKRSAQNYEAIRAELETTLGKLQNAEVRVRELEALAVVESDKARSYMLNAIAETESVQRQLDMARAELREARNYIDTQLAQAQKPAGQLRIPPSEQLSSIPRLCREGVCYWCGRKGFGYGLCAECLQKKPVDAPAAPAGLPEVGENFEYRIFQCDEWKIARRYLPEHGNSNYLYGKYDDTFVSIDVHSKDWRRLPPAQTSREPSQHIADAVPYSCRPAASLPGEVSTENMDKLVIARHEPFRLAAIADIRAAVERERERWEEACASLDLQVTQWASRYADRRKASSAVLSQAAEFKKERDAALAEVEILRKQYSDVCRDWRLEQDRANELARKLVEAESQRDQWKKAAADAEAKAQAEWDRANVVAEAASADRRAKTVALAEVERLKGELVRAKEARRCPADGMRNHDVGLEINRARQCRCTLGPWEAMGAKARELFTPRGEG